MSVVPYIYRFEEILQVYTEIYAFKNTNENILYIPFCIVFLS